MSGSSLFQLSRGQALVLSVGLMTTLVAALSLRYWVIEPTEMGRVCGATSAASICVLRRIVQIFAHYTVFGGLALVAAVINFMRPAKALCALGFTSAVAGLVLYNTAWSACAFIVLLLGFARGTPETE